MNEPSTVIQYFLSPQFFLALVIAVALIPFLKRIAVKIGLIDHPGGRKQHKSSVPLAGGSAIFFATAISLYIWGLPQEFQGMAFAATGLFIVGAIDDRFDISAKFRLLIQASLVAGALYWDNNWLSTVAITDSLNFDLGIFQYPITVLAILGVMNAINMLDGLDGLSSGVVLIILGFIIGISAVAQESSTTLISVCVFGAVLGFWAYNYRFAWREKASVFMGDSGTTLLGFILPFLAIKLSNLTPTYAPQSLLLWLFAIPIWDLCAVVLKRVREGKSPLDAGRDHIHHVLMNAGLSVRHSLHLIYLLTIATISFGVSIRFFAFTKLEVYAAFFVFMAIYLVRVGSLSRRSKGQIYDFARIGDRREPVFEDSTVIDMVKRSKTLS